MSVEEVKPILVDYVNKNSRVQHLYWDQNMARQLLFDPYAKAYHEKTRIAHYFLLVAAITETELTGRAENSRELMIHIHSFLGDRYFEENEARGFEEVVQKCGFFDQMGDSRDQIPKVLARVNSFVQTVAEGDLVGYASRFAKPKEMVREIGGNIPRMGGRWIEKAWMYMRWMTRTYPDLGVFNNFRPQDLYIPLTSCIRNVGFCLGLCSQPRTGWWNNFDKVEQERKRFTEFAKELFPEDPMKIDYPFYMLGRWIEGKQLETLKAPARLTLLKDHLVFWEEVYNKIQRTPVRFDIVSRKESTFEENVRKELEKMQFIFSFEPHVLNLKENRGAPQYTPDFVLPNCRINGKTVILEPHGFWTRRKKRIVKIGRRRFPIWTYPTRTDPDELRFVNKLRKVKRTWGKLYYMILIAPTQVKKRVEEDYPDIFDELYDGRDVPRLLYNLKNHCK